VSDNLLEAEALLVQLPDAVTRRRLGERLGEAVTVLKSADAQITRIQALLETAELLGYGRLPQQREVIDEMIGWARRAGTSLEEAEDGDRLRRAVDEYKVSFVQAVAALERAIFDQWHTQAMAKFQPLVELGRLLLALNVAKDLGSRLVNCGEAGLASVRIGSATERLSMVRHLLANYQALQEARSTELGDDEVGEFIKALADNRATLAMVTPKVHSWLTSHNALDSIGVTTR